MARLCWLLLLPTLAAAERPYELLFVGDVSFAGRRLPKGTLRPEQNPLKAVAERFSRADLVVANGEGLLTDQPPAAYGEARLNIGASPRWAPVYAAAGVDLVGLANNHTWDGGAAGLLENHRHLSGTGVSVYGAAESVEAARAAFKITDADGSCRVAVVPATLKSNRRPAQRGAFAAYYRGAKGLRQLTARIRALSAAGCFVITSVHWGREGVHQPPRGVIAAAHAMVDAGARVVVGHHPHVLQGVEFYGEGVIAYSLGNFVFTNRTPDKRETGMLLVRLSRGGAVSLQELALAPVTIDPRGFFPRPSNPRQRARTVARLRSWSSRWKTQVTENGDRIVFTPR